MGGVGQNVRLATIIIVGSWGLDAVARPRDAAGTAR
jgi:hypothetical protein